MEDAAHIRRALAGLKDKLTVTPGQNVLFGFSQGAQMAFEVAFANPAEYAGAIVMSPGTTNASPCGNSRPARPTKSRHSSAPAVPRSNPETFFTRVRMPNLP